MGFKEDLKEKYNPKKRAEHFKLLNTENEKEVTCEIRSKGVWKRKNKMTWQGYRDIERHFFSKC